LLYLFNQNGFKQHLNAFKELLKTADLTTNKTTIIKLKKKETRK